MSRSAARKHRSATAPRSEKAALAYLARFTDYERMARMPYGSGVMSLSRMRALARAMGDPQDSYRIVHIAGTKGKGSTALYCSALLRSAGLRVGTFLSPHLEHLRERIQLDLRPVGARMFLEALAVAFPFLEARRGSGRSFPTFFELVTALALWVFRRRKVEVAVLEVGMGGRLDSTNIVRPQVAGITRIGRDHEAALGRRLDQIAGEKAGIIKPRVPLVCARQGPPARHVIETQACRRRAPLVRMGRDFDTRIIDMGIAKSGPWIDFEYGRRKAASSRYRLQALGETSVENAAIALELARRAHPDAVMLPEAAIRRALSRVRLPARMEWFGGRPPVVLDGGHTVESTRALLKALERLRDHVPWTLLFASARDKKWRRSLRMLTPHFQSAWVTAAPSPRAVPSIQLGKIAAGIGTCHVQALDDPAAALQGAMREASPGGLVVVTGSFYLAGLLRPLLVRRRASQSG